MKKLLLKFCKNHRKIPEGIVDLVTSTEEILNGKLHFLCSALYYLRLRSSLIGIKA